MNRRRPLTLPHFEYNYGVAPDLQIHIIAPYARGQQSCPRSPLQRPR